MPETIGFIIVSAVADAAVANTAVIGTLTVAQIVGTAVVIAGSVGLNYALSSNPDGPKPQDGQIITRQPVPPRRRAYGRVKLAGPLLFSETSPAPRAGRFQVIALHHGEIDAFEEHWLQEFPIILTGGIDANNGAAAHLDTSPIYGGQVQVETFFGTVPGFADGQVQAAFPTLWTVDHRADGIAWAMVVTRQPLNQENFTADYPGGLAPAYRAVIRASKVWDPRDGTQDKNTPSTWKWSANPVLIALDYHRNADAMGLSTFDSVFFTAAAVNQDWKTAADICDETVGGIPRYLCSGSYSLPTDEPATVLGSILATCDGQLYQRGDGAIGIRVGKTISPSVTLDDTHILGYDALKKGDNVFLACNEVTAKYTSPDHDYQETDADPLRDEADITARGQTLSKALALQWVPQHSQARRLMKLALHRYNPEWSGTIITDMAGLQVFGERYIRVVISELGIDGTFEVTSCPVTISNNAVTCQIGISSLDQSAFDWDEATEAGTPPPVPDGVLGG